MVNWKFIYAVITATGAPAFNHGFNSVLFNIISPLITNWYESALLRRNTEPTGIYETNNMMSLMSSSFPLGGILGSLFICPLVTYVGPKNTIIVSNLITLVGILLQNLCFFLGGFEILTLGRFLVGISAGIAAGATNIYLVEISRYCIRGTVGVFHAVMVSASSSLAYVLGTKSTFGQQEYWHHSFILCYFPCIIQIVTMLFCPESPKHLYFDQQDEDEAEEALAWLREDDIEDEMADYEEENLALKDVGEVKFPMLFTHQPLRSPMIISLVILVGQQLSGIDVVFYFSVQFLMDLEIEPNDAINYSIALSVVNVVGNIISMVLVDRIGRRVLLLGSIAAMITSLCILSLIIGLSTYDSIPDEINLISVLLLFMYVFSYSFGLGTIPWFYAAELNIQPARPMVMSMGMTLNWSTQFIVVAFFLPLKYYVGNYIFLIYIFLEIFFLFFALLTMRETMGLETVDIVDLFYD